MRKPFEPLKAQFTHHVCGDDINVAGLAEANAAIAQDEARCREIVNELTKSNVALRENIQFWMEATFKQNKADKVHRAQLAEAREALEYYADRHRYDSTETMTGTRPPIILVECGQLAREALEKIK